MGGVNVSFRLDKKRLLNLNSATFGPLSFLIHEENKKIMFIKKPLKKTLHPLILCKSSLDILWWKEYLAICDYHLGTAEIVPCIKIHDMNKIYCTVKMRVLNGLIVEFVC